MSHQTTSKLARSFTAEWKRLGAGLKKNQLASFSDPEPLHDLRVSSRRQSALLRWIHRLNGKIKGVKSFLRTIRSLSGATRDADVILKHLRVVTYIADSEKGILIALAVCEKREAFTTWTGQLPALQSRFTNLSLRLSKKKNASWKQRRLKEKPTQSWLRKRIEQLRKRVSENAQNTKSWHQIRLHVKRTRYLLEAFPQSSDENQQFLDVLIKLQTRLGTWHDHLIIHNWLEKLRSSSWIGALDNRRKLASAIRQCERLISRKQNEDQKAIRMMLKEWKSPGCAIEPL